MKVVFFFSVGLGPVSCLSVPNTMLGYHSVLVKVVLLVFSITLVIFNHSLEMRAAVFKKYLVNTTAGLRFFSHCLVLLVT